MGLPIQKQPKPWEKPEEDHRTEILLGVRYDKDFETLFDDRATLKDKKPARIVRIKAHFSKEFLVGIQLTYMTAEEELIEGKFHGDKKVSISNLQKVQYEVQYREKIEEMTAHFSRGIHRYECS